MNAFIKTVLSVGMLLATLPASAKLVNAGTWISNQNVKPGTSFAMHASIYSDAVQSNVAVTLGLHKVENGVVAETPIGSQVFSGQNFVVGSRPSYVFNYTVPSSVQNGTYILVVKAGSAAHNSEYYYAGNPKDYPITVTGGSNAPVVTQPTTPTTPTTPTNPTTPVVDNGSAGSLVNAGVYIPNKSVKAGATVSIQNGVKSIRALPNVQLKLEIHRVLDSGAIDSAVVASQTKSSLVFAANEQKNFDLGYAIPASAVNGKYALTILAQSGDGSVTYFNFQQVLDINSFTVSGGATTTPTNPTTPTTPVVNEPYLRGINIMDPGIGPHTNPGVFMTHYTTPTLQALQLLKGRGLQVVRLPIMWERMQKTPGGALDSEYLGLIMQTLRDANTAGLKIILDLHNYARYTQGGVERIFGQAGAPTQAQFGDVWSRMVIAIKADSAAYNSIYAYDLMNEPHDIPAANGVAGNKVWEQYAQAAVNAIRASGENKMIHVNGYSWASPLHFATNHPTKFINDPANNIMYQAHLYMDDSAGGQYPASFAQEVANSKAQGFASVSARAIYRLKKFTDWCSAQQVRCFIGEFGWPNSAVVGSSDANQWNQTGDEVFQFMDQVRIGVTMWATGSWLAPSGNILNMYTLPGRSTYTFSVLSSAPVLEAHPGK